MRTLIIVIAVCALAAGLALVRAPARAIDFQKRFYLSINWRMEPVDAAKELRNTRAMGVFLIVFVIAVLCYVALRGIMP
jgi:hypothetical protein